MSVELPRDAEGREIPLDTECLYSHGGEKQDVLSFTYYRKKDRWEIETATRFINSTCLYLTPLDSWEKLEEDVNLGCRDYCEKHRLEECDYNMRVHMLDRAKKLAGIEEAER